VRERLKLFKTRSPLRPVQHGSRLLELFTMRIVERFKAVEFDCVDHPDFKSAIALNFKRSPQWVEAV
jgi:hypothetical protein